MRRTVVWSDTARDDYFNILRYIADDNPDAAERVARRLDRVATALGEMPTGRLGRVKGTHEKVISGLPYILAYEVEVLPQGGERVVILHVIHGARDWPEERWPED